MSKNIINIKNLSISFSINDTIIKAVDDISFKIDQGEILALVGESGSGKSVTALSLLQLLPKNVSYDKGEIFINSINILDKKNSINAIRGKEASMIFQEPMTSLNPLHTIEKQIKESITLFNKLNKKELSDYLEHLLNLVGLNELISRKRSYPHELSGGQKQRVMIAMAIANKPKLLIADEPTTALDVTVQKQILELLKDLQTKLNMSMLLISHDLSIVKQLAKNICVMKDGKIIEKSEINKIFLNPNTLYTKKLINSEPEKKVKNLNKINQNIIEIKNLNVKYPIKKGFFKKTNSYLNALNEINLKVKSGETLGIVGESGCGKTTLGLALLKLLKSNGSIKYNNTEISILKNSKLRPLRKEMQMVFQDPYSSLSPRLSIKQIIEEGLLVHNKNMDKKLLDKSVEEALTNVGLDIGFKNRYPHEFSGGQRQRIAIARAIILKPKLLVLDEPTSALDKTVQNQIIILLKELQIKFKLTYLFISHNIRVVRSMSDSIAVMKKGEIIEYGSSDEIFINPKHTYTKLLMDSVNLV
ncbi:dipeptide ABC transporter ATP-binding protein [Alphaproteobacteria bacterium]|nr:dipeptide ABC transporter ATP-binding protein [Alphaproteobacteria bacterium]